MGNQYKFNGFFLMYDCPLCGKPKSKNGTGQSILWIALECISSGYALSHCDNCGGAFKFPDGIFAEGMLGEFQKISQIPGDYLYDYVTKVFVNSNSQDRILEPNWYHLLLEANSFGPVDTLNMQWDRGEKCPNCGSNPNPYPISFNYLCPFCGYNNSVAQQDIDVFLGVRVLCRNCFRPLLVPQRVWCPKCSRALVDYYQILRYIADENNVPVEKLESK